MFNKRIVARFYKLIVSTEASQFVDSSDYSPLQEMFYFKTKQLFDSTITVRPKEFIVNQNNWASGEMILHAALEYAEGLEFEDIITYRLQDLKTGKELKVFLESFLSDAISIQTQARPWLFSFRCLTVQLSQKTT